MMKRIFTLGLIALSLTLVAAACSNEAGADENFEENVADTRLNPDPTPEGELGDTTKIGDFKGDTDRGFGVPLEIGLGEELFVEAVINVRLTFLAVLEDTRCPEGQACDDPGRAAINVAIRLGGLALGETEFALEGGVAGDPRRMAGDLSIQLLDLQPLPNADGTEITDYVATVQLIR